MIDLSTIDALRAAALASNTTEAALTSQVGGLNAQVTALSTQLRASGIALTDAQADADLYVSTLLNIETLTNWIQPSNTGDTGGGSSKPNGTFLMTPGPAGSPATFSARGNYPYNNGYFYTPLMPSSATSFRLALQFMLPTAADLAASQAIEFELQQCIGTVFFNMAWQCTLIGNKLWNVFNKLTEEWEPTNIPAKITAGTWTSVVANFVRTATSMVHVGITINGQWYPVLAAHAPVATKDGPYLHAAFQLDSNGGNPPTPYLCQVRNYNVSWK